MATVSYAHIELNDRGRPIISGTRMKVAMIVRDRLAGLDAEQIQQRYPYLSLGQVHSALAYYYDNKEEMDREIERRDRLAEEMRAAAGESPLLRELKEQGLIP